MNKGSYWFDRLDLFASPMPRFHIEGHTNISTSVGLTFSTIAYLILVGYTTSRFFVLILADSPELTTFTIENGYNLTDQINLQHYGFQMAFSVE